MCGGKEPVLLMALGGLALLVLVACSSSSPPASTARSARGGETALATAPAAAFSSDDPAADDTAPSHGGPLVLYTFEEGSGSTIADTATVASPLDLTIDDMSAVEWVEGGLRFVSPARALSNGPATGVIDAARTTSELTIEAWVEPASDTQDGPARIVTISFDPYLRNVTLAQGLWGDLPPSLYTARLRTTETDFNGIPSLSSSSNSLKLGLTHLVYTYDAAGVARLFIDGEEAASMFVGGTLANWDRSYPLVVANEMHEQRPWLGTLYLVAIYPRSLTPTEVEQHYQAGADGEYQAALPAPQPVQSTSPPATPFPSPPREEPPPEDLPAPAVPAADSLFPLGVFEDSGMLGGNTEMFRAMGQDITAHGFDAVMFTNTYAERDAPLLDVSDELGINVFMMPAGDFNRSWWGDDVPADLETARQVARPVVHRFAPHPSFKGYLVKDEPRRDAMEKVALMTRALRELDPARPATPILVGTDRVGPIFSAAQPPVLLIDVYPAGYHNPVGDFTMSGFGYQHLDFVSYIREVTQSKPPSTPLWVILQTHSLNHDPRFALREPTPAEVRAQNWLAIGEGATGIFWFIYSSQQGWRGLGDNPALYAEVSTLAQRVAPLRDTLRHLQRVAAPSSGQFTVAGAGDAYISTLATPDHTRFYAVVVNRDCLHAQELTIEPPADSEDLRGQLRDLETLQTYEMGEAILFSPGDGKLFELVRK